jgi:hypothetical protein
MRCGKHFPVAVVDPEESVAPFHCGQTVGDDDGYVLRQIECWSARLSKKYCAG